jgi:hypothetical protein
MVPIASFSDLWESPVWSVGATILTALAIGVSIYFFIKQRQRKRLTYGVTITELVSVHGDAKDKIEIFYEREIVERVHLVEVTLKNTGNVAIPASDYEVPFSVGLGEGAEVLTAEVVRTEPAGLTAELEFVKEPRERDRNADEQSVENVASTVTLKPLLLNPGDQLTIKILVADFVGEPEFDHRIIGVSRLSNSADPKEGKWKRWWDSGAPLVWALFFLLLAGAYGVGHNAGEPDHKESAIRLLGGKTYCGAILKTTNQHLILQTHDTGVVSTIPMDRVISIKDDSC